MRKTDPVNSCAQPAPVLAQIPAPVVSIKFSHEAPKRARGTRFMCDSYQHSSHSLAYCIFKELLIVEGLPGQ